jgi:hypothetical protein
VANTATLGQMLVDLRAELGQSLSPAQATQIAPAHRVRLQRVQRVLWADFAWPHLRTRYDVALAAGQRYYDLPTGLVLERVEKVEVQWGTHWYPLSRGIGADEYNAFDSAEDERSEPALRWEAAPNGQFEIWPLAASDTTQMVRFTGIAGLAAFVDEADVCTLDRDLIVLTAASELARDAAEAQKFGARAKRLYDQLKGNAEFGGARAFNLNGDGSRPGRWPTPPRVARN